MKICIFGAGYVGLVAAACFAESGNSVIAVDVDEAKIEGLKQGIIPIYEPGLKEMVLRNQAEGRLSFTTDAVSAVQSSLVMFHRRRHPPRRRRLRRPEIRSGCGPRDRPGHGRLQDHRRQVHRPGRHRRQGACGCAGRAGHSAESAWNSMWFPTRSSSRKAPPSTTS